MTVLLPKVAARAITKLAVMLVLLTVTILAVTLVPDTVMPVAPAKFVPVMVTPVTVVPRSPKFGLIEVIVGWVTVNELASVAVPPAVVFSSAA